MFVPCSKMADENVSDVGAVKMKETLIPCVFDGKFFKITKADEAGRVMATNKL